MKKKEQITKLAHEFGNALCWSYYTDEDLYMDRIEFENKKHSLLPFIECLFDLGILQPKHIDQVKNRVPVKRDYARGDN